MRILADDSGVREPLMRSEMMINTAMNSGTYLSVWFDPGGRNLSRLKLGRLDNITSSIVFSVGSSQYVQLLDLLCVTIEVLSLRFHIGHAFSDFALPNLTILFLLSGTHGEFGSCGRGGCVC